MTIIITLEIVERYTGGIEGFAQNTLKHDIPTVFRCSDVPAPCSMLSVCSMLVILGSPPHTERHKLTEVNLWIETTDLHGLPVV